MQRPIVIVPGYYGSELVDIATGSLLWIDPRAVLQSGKTLDRHPHRGRQAGAGEGP
jgi:hypothetical protein